MNNLNNVKFYNFPHDFNKNDNFFIDLCNEVSKNADIDFPIHFYGCYPEISFIEKTFLYFKSRITDSAMTKWLTLQQGIEVPVDKHAFNIWCTFENRRPPASNFNLTFSFDIDDYSDSNYYLPLIYLYMNHRKEGKTHSKHKITPKQCTQPRLIDLGFANTKSGFVSSFINNPQQTRLFAIKELSRIAKVSVYGRSVGNYVEDKISEAKKYWFNLCFENDFYPGYVTEKVLEAWLAKSIPIYWGSDSKKILNPKAYINFNDFSSAEEFVKYIYDLYSDEKRMIEMISQPILNSDFDYESLVNFFTRKLEYRDD
jgi:hypothetical protein